MDGVRLPEQSWFGYHLEPVNPVYSPWAGVFFLVAYINFFYIGYCAIVSYKKNDMKILFVWKSGDRQAAPAGWRLARGYL